MRFLYEYDVITGLDSLAVKMYEYKMMFEVRLFSPITLLLCYDRVKSDVQKREPGTWLREYYSDPMNSHKLPTSTLLVHC